MLELFFSFRGRLNRLRYFATILLLAGLATLLVIAAVFGIGAAAVAHQRASLSTALLVVLGSVVLAIALLWISFALQAKRIRDIGLDPVIVIPAAIVIGVIDSAAAHTYPGFTVMHLGHQTFVGLAFQVSYGFALLFWPGRGYDGGIAAPGWSAPVDEPPHDPFPNARSSPSPFPAGTGGWPAAAATRGGFGRRGL